MIENWLYLTEKMSKTVYLKNLALYRSFLLCVYFPWLSERRKKKVKQSFVSYKNHSQIGFKLWCEQGIIIIKN